MVITKGDFYNKDTPAKILIIRFSSIGDIVLTTPVIRCIKEQIPDVKLHYLTKTQYSEILRPNNYIDKLHLLKGNIRDTIKELRSEKFEYIVDLHHNQRTLIIKAALACKSYSFKKLNLAKWLMVKFKINRLKPVHLVERYLDTVRQLGVANDKKGLDYFIPPEEEVDLKSLPAVYQNGYTGFVIGAVHFTKRLPVNKIITICKRLKQPVILLGGMADTLTGEEIANKAGERVFNACGKFSINQSASLVKQASKIITHDTGLMHIAAAFQKPIVSIWGNTIPEFGMYPYYGQMARENKQIIIETNGLDCRPCSKIGYSRCPKNHFKCMELISEQEVADGLAAIDS